MVVFFNISNPFGYRNSFGYNFVDFDSTELDSPNEKLPVSLRSVFIGCFMFFSGEGEKHSCIPKAGFVFVVFVLPPHSPEKHQFN